MARRHFKTIVQPMMIEAMREFYELSKSVDCVLYHVKSLADFFADQFPGKMIRANVIPAIEPTSTFPNPVFSALALPGFMNRLTYKLADLGLAMMNDAIKQFRVSSSLSKDYPKKLKLPSIYGISPSFLPFPRDYPQDSQFTGFWYGRSNDELPADVTNFLSTKKKSVLLTFGSMPFETKLNLSEALRDLSKRLDINVIIVRGWGFGKASGIDEESVKMIPSAPYEKLIPKVDAVLFHGGIGTMAECLRAGVPFLACPVIYPMGDQHFWGKRAHDLGCAPKPLPLKKLTSDLLISNVSDLLSSPRYNASCKRMSKALADEDGLTTAVDFVESKIIQAK